MKQRVRGFTLIELMVSIGILAILVAVAIPSFTSVMVNYRLTSIANTFVASAQLARSEAIKRNGRVTMCKSADGVTCTVSGSWNQGWILFHDVDNNAAKGTTEAIIHRESAMPVNYLTMRPGGGVEDHYISFTASGGSELISGAFQATTVTLCSQVEPIGQARQMVLNSVGRLRVQKTTVSICT